MTQDWQKVNGPAWRKALELFEVSTGAGHPPSDYSVEAGETLAALDIQPKFDDGDVFNICLERFTRVKEVLGQLVAKGKVATV